MLLKSFCTISRLFMEYFFNIKKCSNRNTLEIVISTNDQERVKTDDKNHIKVRMGLTIPAGVLEIQDTRVWGEG